MEQHCSQPLGTPRVQESPSDKSRKQTAAAQAYRAPRLYIIGKAIDLIQGYSCGEYSDGYTGYYWER